VAVAAVLALAAVAGGAPSGAGAAQRGGGELTFLLEAETNGYCLSRAQLAISGIQVATAIYDTLTVPNAKGEIVPYLAESVTPSDDLMTWTITLRPDVTFHDGTPLDAEAVKLNLDSYRGAPGAPNTGDLFLFYFNFVTDVRVVDPLTVEVTLDTPVADFASYLFATGRLGIMAPAQLNAGDACATNLIGTGPFVLSEYRQNEQTVVTKNPDYWQPGYPKAEQITFVPVPEGSARVTQLQGGDADLLHTDQVLQLLSLQDLGDQVKLLTQKPGLREIHYYFLLTDSPPFDDPKARLAFATAIDREAISKIRANGLREIANSIMDRDSPGYVKNAGYPKFNLKRARQLVEEYEAEHGPFEIVIGTTTDAESANEMQVVSQQLAKAGIDAQIAQFDQATQIAKALSGDVDMLEWRNLHGAISSHNDEAAYIWFSSYDTGNLVNFGHFSDPTAQSLLDQGRAQTEPAQIRQTYQDFNRAMAKQVYLLPVWYVNWTIAAQRDVRLTLPPLPDGNGKPLFVYGRIPLLAVSKA
jgi:peptide/nickel transport system substrate-binding protein